jgi:hypothetical protein
LKTINRYAIVILTAILILGFSLSGCSNSGDSKAPAKTKEWPQPPTPTSTLNVPHSPTFRWMAVAGATSYEVQINTNYTFPDISSVIQVTDTNSITWQPFLLFSRIYFWRWRAATPDGFTDWSTPVLYTTELNPLSDEGRAPS